MGFDSFIDEFDKADENKVNTTPAIITETIEVGTKLIDTDYLDKIKHIEILKPYLVKFKHMNLYQLGWRFQFGSSKQWAGLCSTKEDSGGKSKDRNIYVSIQYTRHDKNWKENMQSIILHEIAHAIVREIFFFSDSSYATLNSIDPTNKTTGGHGVIFSEVCHAISGAKHNCGMSYADAQLSESIKNYKYDCPSCEHVAYGNSILFAKRCEKCDKSIIVEPNVR